jgi:hypothetical protein
LTPNFSDITVRLRFCSAGLLLAALLTHVFRNKVRIWIEEAVLPLPRFLGGVVGSLGRSLKADGPLDVVILLALSLLGIALRVRFLFQPIGLDEAETFLSYASRPLYIGLSSYTPNNHLLHTLLLHFAWRLFGDHEWVIRLPALLAGCLLIPITYWATRTLYDKHSAFIAASIVATASPLITYSVAGRGYTLVCLLFLLLLITSQYLLKHDNRPAWLLWAVIAALGFYSMPTMLYAVGTAALWLILSSRKMGSKKASVDFLISIGSTLAVTAALTTLLYLPVLIASGWKSLVSNDFVRSKGLAYVVANSLVGFSQIWNMWTADVPRFLIWILAAGFVVGLVFHGRIARNSAPVPLAAALCIPPLLLIQRVIPYARIWLFLLPLCAAVCGAGLQLLVWRLGGRTGYPRSSGLAAAIALGCLALMCGPDLRGARFAARSVPTKIGDGSGRTGPAKAEPYPGYLLPAKIQDTTVWLKGHLTPHDVVVANWPTAPLRYYIRLEGIPLESHPAPCDPLSIVLTPKGPPLAQQASGDARVLVLAKKDAKPETALSAACLTGQIRSAPRLVYSGPGMQVYESYLIPGARLAR